jgi:hypothetical protein
VIFVDGFKTSPVIAVIDTQLYRFHIALKWSKSAQNIIYLFIFTDFTDSEQLHDMYASLRIIGMITDYMGLVCGTHGEKRNAHGILVGKPEGKRPP